MLFVNFTSIEQYAMKAGLGHKNLLKLLPGENANIVHKMTCSPKGKIRCQKILENIPKEFTVGRGFTLIQVTSDGKHENTSTDRFLRSADQETRLPCWDSGPLVQVAVSGCAFRRDGEGLWVRSSTTRWTFLPSSWVLSFP